MAWDFFTTVYLANLQTIPTELYEAAKIDGREWVQRFPPDSVPNAAADNNNQLRVGTDHRHQPVPQIVVTTKGGPRRVPHVHHRLITFSIWAYRTTGRLRAAVSFVDVRRRAGCGGGNPGGVAAPPQVSL